MRYAFAYGADAVYAGQPRYSLRVRNNEFSKEAVLALFDGKVARYKRPSDVIFVDEPLPRTSLGKVQKFELRKRLGL